MAVLDDHHTRAHLLAARRFESKLRELTMPTEGLSALPLAPPCRPTDLETDDLPLSFEGSFDGQLLAPDWTLVHGYIGGIDERDREAYAWLEHDQLQVVYDVELDRIYRISDYPVARGVVAVARYDADEAQRLREGHPNEPYGPWTDDGPMSWIAEGLGLQ